MGSKQYGSIGSVSHGTMRTEDLIPSFVWEAKHLRLTREERKRVTEVARASEKKGYFDTEDADYDLNEVLFNILDAHSPAYCYFGSHPGDGSDYGWWVSEMLEDDFDGLKVNDTSEVPQGYRGEVLHVSDHGNLTLYVAGRRGLREVWGIV